MEAIDTQRRFEELVSELERLKDAADLIDENASNVEEISETTADILDDLRDLVPSVEEVLENERQHLRKQAEQLTQLRENIESYLEEAKSERQEHLDSLSNTLDEALKKQKALLGEFSEDYKGTLNAMGGSIREDVQNVDQRIGTLEDQTEEMHERTVTHTGKIVRQLTGKTHNHLEELSAQMEKQKRQHLLVSGGLGILIAILAVLQFFGG